MDDLISSSDLVGQIAGFTSLRDVDLLELSLLKSIFTIANPIEVSLITLDSQNIILKKIEYSAQKYGTLSSKIEADDRLMAACDQLDNSSQEYCTITSRSNSLTLYLLSQSRKISHYVTIESSGIGVLKSYSQQIMGMLKIYRNFKQLILESQTDELTGLSNRKAFDSVVKKIHEVILPIQETIENEKRNAELEKQYWLTMMDIDHFKKINDQHGHLMGDEVLVRISQIMQSSLRDTDLLYRYGGEEFSVISNAKCKDDVNEFLERVRVSVENINIPQIGKITISMGVVEMKKELFYMELVERADKALYESKANGRNQITFYDNKQAVEDASDSNNGAELF